MELSRYIIDLLIESEKAEIPNLGVFISRYVPAKIYKFSNKVAPPAIEILFEEKEIQGIISDELVNQVSEIKEKLSNNQVIELEGLGRLSNENGNLKFKAFPDNLIAISLFGFESVKIPDPEASSIAGNESVPLAVKTKEPVPLSRILGIAGILAILLLIAGGFYTGYFERVYKSISSYITEKKEQYSTDKKESSDSISNNIDAKTNKRNALLYTEKETQEAAQNASEISSNIRYYIIAGSFKTLTNAEKHKSELAKKGYNPAILTMNDTLYRITLGSFDERKKAVEEFIMLSNQDTNLRIWLFSRKE